MAERATLIHHDGALGDVLLSLPCLKALKEGAGILHFVGKGEVADLLKQTGCVDECTPSDSSLFIPLYQGGHDDRLVGFLRQIDRAVVFTVRQDSPVAAGISGYIPDTRVVLTIPGNGNRTHVAGYRMRQIIADSPWDEPLQVLEVSPSQKERAREFLRSAGFRDSGGPLVAVHPGSGGKAKCWSLEGYLSLVERLCEKGYARALIFSGPAETDETRRKIDEFAQSHAHVRHVSNTALILVAALISLSTCYVGNDSGISHLSGSVGTRTIALFGPTEPALWRPLGRRVKVIVPKSNDGRLSDISVQEVYSAVVDGL